MRRVLIVAMCAACRTTAPDAATETSPRPTPPPIIDASTATAIDAPVPAADRCQRGEAAGCIERGFEIDVADGPAVLAAYARACSLSATECWYAAELQRKGTAGVPADAAKARQFYQRGCDADQWHECEVIADQLMIGEGSAQDIPRAAKLYEKICNGSDQARPCTSFALLLVGGEGVLRDVPRGIELLSKACNATYNDFGRACAELGRRFQTGDGVTADRRRGLAYALRGCGGGFGCLPLGRRFEDGDGVTPDRTRAIGIYLAGCLRRFERVACEEVERLRREPSLLPLAGKATRDRLDATCRRDPAACVPFGLLYEYGYGVPRDRARATALYRSACNAGAPAGCGRSGYAAYAANDLARAAPLLERACTGAHLVSCRILGNVQREARDLAAARVTYRAACDAGDAHSCSALAGELNDDLRARLALLDRACRLGDDAVCGDVLTAGIRLEDRKQTDTELVLWADADSSACRHGAAERCFWAAEGVRTTRGQLPPDLDDMSRLLEVGCDAGAGESCAAASARATDPGRRAELAKRACELAVFPQHLECETVPGFSTKPTP